MNIKKLSDWGISANEPLLIAGPCSAETEEQVLTTARQLQEVGIDVYRAGIWKPRTRPNSFEGIGSKGLSWLKLVKQETGIPVTTEIANTKHVDEALKAEIDILWIGARTSVNPFAVQEIADALKGVDIPVMVKNPVNPDLELWIGAIERIYHAGIRKLGAIHRGFSSYEHSKFKNAPQWQIPIELKRRLPTLPMICDPSHIGGTRALIAPVSQKALDLNFDGLMIESHCDPTKALSDAKQQVTPHTLKALVEQLVKRKVKPDNISLTDLEDLRFRIDQHDQELLNVLKKRMKIVVEIGKYKKQHGMTILQPNRWNTIMHSTVEKGTNLGLSEDMVKSIFKSIHQESINTQEDILTK